MGDFNCIYICVYINVYTYMYMCMCICMYMCVCVCVYIYKICFFGLDEAEARIKIARRNINNLRYADDTILKVESKEELKNLLMKVKEKSVKAGLKLIVQKTKIMASRSHHFTANRWGKKWKQWWILFSWAAESLQMVTAAMKLKDTCTLEGKLWQT